MATTLDISMIKQTQHIHKITKATDLKLKSILIMSSTSFCINVMTTPYGKPQTISIIQTSYPLTSPIRCHLVAVISVKQIDAF